MTHTQPAPSDLSAVNSPRRITRTAKVLIVVVALLIGALAYVATFGQCDMDSKFCHVSAAGTRSEVVVAWLDGFEVYGQTYPGQ